MSATRRLNERLAKYNYMYDDDKPAPLATDEEITNGSVEVVVSSDGESARSVANSEETSSNSNNNNIEVPERVPVRKLTENIIKREASTKRDGPPTKYEAPSTKFDPSLRERDGKAEKTLKAESVTLSPRPLRSDLSLEGYVGFANLPNQVYRKAVKRGFEFTMMLVGESGLGKSTMINSLFLSEVYGDSNPGPSMRSSKTTQIDSTDVVLKETGVQLKLKLVDTPGFGDAVDNTDCWKPLTAFVDNKYDEYLNAESKVNRKVLLEDNRVHCCLYFIAPTGHSLKPLDIEVMKRLHEKVNIVPLIAKADTLTPEECRDFKKNILNEIQRHNIKIYEFPDVDDEEETRALKRLRSRVPFAVVGSNSVTEVNGRKVRCRQYPWGVVEVDNLEHNDFLALRDMLIRTHMQDLKDVTNNVHYENFRFNKLADVSVTDGTVSDPGRDPLSQMEEQKKEHRVKMKKMEAEMEQVFELKVREKMQKLQDSEIDLQNRAEQMKKSLDHQQREIEEKRQKFEAEKAAWEAQHGTVEDHLAKGKTKKGMFH